MIKIFISHKLEDSYIANRIADELEEMDISYYLDILDYNICIDGKKLTEHIKSELNDCTDIIVIISDKTKNSQWVPFEIGMAAQKDMPTATFLQENVKLPEFLEYWPRLKKISDIRKYITTRKDVQKDYRYIYETSQNQKSQTERFYDILKKKL